MMTSAGLNVAMEVRLSGFALAAEFEVPAGLTVLFGRSGAGKSLTLQAIAGLVPLSHGHVRLGERVLVDMARRIAVPARERHVGYVPQHYALFPHLSVAQNVAYALRRPATPWDHATRKERALRVAELLALVRLAGFEERLPYQLSGGQAQRVALARALAARPAALLLDEPLGALDAPTRAAVQDDLRRVVVESAVPTLVVTHDLAEARTLGDRMVVLAGGAVVASGTVGEVLANPPTAEAALLLGWRNVVAAEPPLASGSGVVVGLAGGQTVTVERGQGAAAGEHPALALHADQLELLPASDAHARDTGAARVLHGEVVAVADRGAHYLVSVRLAALEGARAGGPVLMVTCSPREWAALGMARGAPVGVRVPSTAARLVVRDENSAGSAPGGA